MTDRPARLLAAALAALSGALAAAILAAVALAACAHVDPVERHERAVDAAIEHAAAPGGTVDLDAFHRLRITTDHGPDSLRTDVLVGDSVTARVRSPR